MSIIFVVLGLTSVATVGFFVYKYNKKVGVNGKSILGKAISSIKNSAHDALDEIEDKKSKARQILRDYDNQINLVRNNHITANAQFKNLEGELKKYNGFSDALNIAIKKALDNNLDAEALVASKRLVQVEETIENLKKQIEHLSPALKSLDAKLEALVDKKETLNHKVQMIESRQATLEATKVANKALGLTTSNDLNDIEKSLDLDEFKIEATTEADNIMNKNNVDESINDISANEKALNILEKFKNKNG